MVSEGEGPDGDPILHTFWTDQLPETHPWARLTVICGCCGQMVHAFNNETMQNWLEWGDTALCWDCALPRLTSDLSWSDWKAVASEHQSVDLGE